MMEIQPELLEQYEYLVRLRDKGTVNMFGADEYLQEAFGLGRREAPKVLMGWMRSFDLPEGEQPKDGR
jgi:hypothetical protein